MWTYVSSRNKPWDHFWLLSWSEKESFDMPEKKRIHKGSGYECKYQIKRSGKKSQIQIKCNKEMKSTTSERQRFAVGPISSKTPAGYPPSAQVISAGDIQPNTKPFSTGLIQSSIQPIPSGISLFSQPFIIPSSKQPILTNTDFWPTTIHRFGTPDYHHIYPYETVVLPNTVSSCYGYHSKFLDLERAFSTNLVIKHRDRCITGRSTTEELLIAADY